MRFREVRERKEVERRFDTWFDPDRRMNPRQQNNNQILILIRGS